MEQLKSKIHFGIQQFVDPIRVVVTVTWEFSGSNLGFILFYLDSGSHEQIKIEFPTGIILINTILTL